VIYGAPEVVGFAVDLYELLVQMPLQVRMTAKVLNPFSSNLRGKHRTETVPQEPHGFMADIDAALMQQILDVAKGKRKPDVHHHSKVDDLQRCFEVTEWAVFFHLETLPPPALPVSSRFLLTVPSSLLMQHLG
jgi:hypothetical protein